MSHVSGVKTVTLDANSSSGINRNLTLLATCFHAGFLLAYFSTLKMEAICSSEASVDFQQTARHYIPEDGTLYKLKFKYV
jgi:hypothetical protein